MAHDGHPHHHHHHDHSGHNHHGHNGPPARQWQTPHLPAGEGAPRAVEEQDTDLVETAFLDTFPSAPDPTSFLRLAGIPFVGTAADGRVLKLLRVEIAMTADVGSLTPHLGGESHRYDPLPAKLASKRRKLSFIYFDGSKVVAIDLAAAKQLVAEPIAP